MVKIVIVQSVYEAILMHILQYGNKSLKKTNEVMGLLYGVRAGDIVTLRKTIPLKHGPDCEKVFSETDLVSFGEIDTKIMKDNPGLEPFGYYTSHPKMGFYLSKNEIKNLLYFIQQKKNPNAIAIIGDHIQMEQADNFGLKAFQLKDAGKGMNSDFTPIDLDIEKPQGMTIFKTLKFLIEQAQKRQLYVEEQGMQLAADESLWDSALGAGDSAAEKTDKTLEPIVKVMKSEVNNYEQSFLAASLKTYNEFIENITQFASKSLNDPSSDLIALRENFESGMVNITGWFETTFKKYAEKALEEYNRTYSTIEEGQAGDIKAIKMMLIMLKAEYERVLKALG